MPGSRVAARYTHARAVLAVQYRYSRGKGFPSRACARFAARKSLQPSEASKWWVGRSASPPTTSTMGWFDDNHWAGEAYDFGFGYMCGGYGLSHFCASDEGDDSDEDGDSDEEFSTAARAARTHVEDVRLSAAEQTAKAALLAIPIEQRSNAFRELDGGKDKWRQMSWADRLTHVRSISSKMSRSSRKSVSSASASAASVGPSPSVATSSRPICSAPLGNRRGSLPAAPAFSPRAERKRPLPATGDFECSYCGKVLKTAGGRRDHEIAVHIKRSNSGCERHASRYQERRPHKYSRSWEWDHIESRRYNRSREVRFLRPGGTFELKDVGWCIDNGMVDCGDYWACSYDQGPAVSDDEDEARRIEQLDAEAEAQLQCDRDLEKQRTEQREQAQVDAWHAQLQANVRVACEEERRLHQQAGGTAGTTAGTTACSAVIARNVAPVVTPIERAWPARTPRFEPMQTWAEMSAILAREACAELRARAGFYVDEPFEEYELKLMPTGEIRRWRVVQMRALTDFERACLATSSESSPKHL